ncbi:FMN reductase [Prauserella shujinwangii]|uniref:FMN reductase n=1 Tax=Prauserella shujinwangii TaxID=1453103 RepID=A0A2T0M3Q1_9PSEU|nr:NAD(P)H-dependent oxidoreductase [Prauserella shujinwangii]PRX51378.1 FMN reductase [Prauserella shujinwangii]
MKPLRIVFLSGSLGVNARADRLSQWCARRAAACGAGTTVFRGEDLEFPMYRPDRPERTERQRLFVEALAGADGVVTISPSYHGTPSGLLKNALDYLNDLGDDPRPFLDGRAIGCVAIAGGEQGAVSTLNTLRAIGHAMRAWPVPLGVTLSGERANLAADGAPLDPAAAHHLEIMLGQVLALATTATFRDRAATAPA